MHVMPEAQWQPHPRWAMSGGNAVELWVTVDRCWLQQSAEPGYSEAYSHSVASEACVWATLPSFHGW